MTGSDIIKDVRPITGDLTGSKWSDAAIMQKVNIARRRIFLDRPEAFWTEDNGVVVEFPEDIALTDTDEDLEMVDQYQAAVSHHVAYQLLLQTDTAKANEQLQIHIAALG